MKNKILFLLAACLSASAFAAPCELRINQRNNTDTSTFMRSVPPTTCATSMILMHNGSTELPQYAALGSGLSWNGTTLAITPAWSSITGVPSTFTPSAHTHVIGDVTGLQTALDGKADSVHTHIISQVTDATTVGQNLVKAVDAAAARSAIGAGTSSFSGAYPDLTSIPSTFAPSAHTHPAAQISDSTTTGRAVLTATDASAARTAIGAGTSSFSGAYADLSGIPSTFSPSAHTHAASDITSGTLVDARIPALAISKTTGLQTALDGKETAGAAATAQAFAIQRTNHTGVQAISTVTGLQTALDGKLAIPTGTTAQYVDGTGALQTTPVLPSQVVNEPTRSLVNATNATGFQISATRNALACYDGSFTTTSTIGGPSSGSVYLETANTNSTTPSDWTIKATQTSSQTITLAIVLQSVDGEPWSFCRIIPAGKYVRLRAATNSGTVSHSINTPSQETLF